MLGFQPIQPAPLLRSAQVRDCLFGQRQKVLCLPAANRLQCAKLGQPLQPVLPDRLQHDEPRLTVRSFDPAQQALGDQRLDCVEHIVGRRLGFGR